MKDEHLWEQARKMKEAAKFEIKCQVNASNSPEITPMTEVCSYPKCNCSFDMGPDNKCLRGYPIPYEVIEQAAVLGGFYFYVIGAECDNEEDAWISFRTECRRMFRWINGEKIWRSPPKVFHDRRFDSQKDTYIVRARVIALDKVPDGFDRARVDGPYPEEKNPFDGAIGFTL